MKRTEVRSNNQTEWSSRRWLDKHWNQYSESFCFGLSPALWQNLLIMKPAAYVPRYVPRRAKRIFPGSEVTSPPFRHFHQCLQDTMVPQNRVCRTTHTTRFWYLSRGKNMEGGSLFCVDGIELLYSGVNSFQTPTPGLLSPSVHPKVSKGKQCGYRASKENECPWCWLPHALSYTLSSVLNPS